MSPHAMPSDTDAIRVDLIESLEDCLGQLFGNVGVHVVIGRPWGGSCIDVEAGAGAEVVAIIFAFDANSTCTGSAGPVGDMHQLHTRASVRVEHCNASLACAVLEEAFLSAIVTRACQARQPDQEWYFGFLCLGWKVEVEFHLASCS